MKYVHHLTFHVSNLESGVSNSYLIVEITIKSDKSMLTEKELIDARNLAKDAISADRYASLYMSKENASVLLVSNLVVLNEE